MKATKCLQEANRQVHLIGVEGGHLQPFAQHSPLGSTPFGILENLFVVGIKRATIYKNHNKLVRPQTKRSKFII